jgi:hypothetical protein
MGKYAHEVFISYANQDRAWAERLAEELKRRGITYFLDRESLRAGTDWKTKILEALSGSQHLVVLWSKHAKQSDWVINERTRFDMRPRAEGGPPERLIFVLLDDQPAAFNALQMIGSVRDTNGYSVGPAAMDAAVWNQVMLQIEEGIRGAEEFEHIQLGLITTTRTDLSGINFSAIPPGPGAESLEALLQRMEVQREDLPAYYGERRQDWRPFGGHADTIETILENVRTQLNATSGGTKFRWEQITDNLFSNKEKIVEHAAARLASDPAVIVIDPLALYEPHVSYLFNNYLYRCFENDKALIMVLSLYPMPSQSRYLRDMVKQINRRLIELFYEDPPLRIPYAHCSVFTGDERDIMRLLRTQLRVYARVGRPASTPEALKTDVSATNWSRR